MRIHSETLQERIHETLGEDLQRIHEDSCRLWKRIHEDLWEFARDLARIQETLGEDS